MRILFGTKSRRGRRCGGARGRKGGEGDAGKGEAYKEDADKEDADKEDAYQEDTDKGDYSKENADKGDSEGVRGVGRVACGAVGTANQPQLHQTHTSGLQSWKHAIHK